ncbi:hypothetical protein [Pyxidicoccus xibeiensis]|uniref:hypothetical protein n=1 Tax=Pyxidicoccus xibeiensis TaxID=2906759 RepID=UPI0020A6E834|nr:hypothetical protein [Pyxidicoccus xibeiensis]MCP3144637.1 hypothetical protein [Pyxidicoccus xibeiensis]
MSTFMRAMAVLGASLAMAACGGDLASEEPLAPEAAALAQTEAELGACTAWSEWTATGYYYCLTHLNCGGTWQCIPELRNGGDTTSLQGQDGEPDEFIPECPPGTVLTRVLNPSRTDEQMSYRVCFNEAGTYTHTERQYRNFTAACGC